MRTIMCWLVFLAAPGAFAADEVTRFDGVQQECAQVGGISFGPAGRWAYCRVTRGRWVATMEFIDLYQAQYCLGNAPDACDQRALVLFGNRAYTPEATVLLVRTDVAGTEYEDPLVVVSGAESVMSITARHAAEGERRSYYLWRSTRWIPLDGLGWLPRLAGFLPAGVAARNAGWPDLETMHAQVGLYRPRDADCCPSGGQASVELQLADGQFAVRQVTVIPPDE